MFCYFNKQRITSASIETRFMRTPPINQVLADNLRHFMSMSPYSTQKALGEKSGIAQRTIGNYLTPALRLEGSKGKQPSANLADRKSVV